MEVETQEITQENYREFNAINYSTLKALANHPSKVGVEIEESPGIRKGSLLDLFCYEGEDAVHDKYYISTIDEMPTDTIKEIIEASPDYDDDTLVQTARDMNYGADNWKDSTILGKITKGGGAKYIYELENAAGKPIISFELFSQMQQACNKLKNHQFTRTFFTDDWKVQSPIASEIKIDGNNVLFKGLLDGWKQKIDYAYIHDLKFTSNTLKGFKSDFMHYKYYLQASLYTDLLWQHIPHSIVYFNIVYSAAEDRVQAFKVNDSMIDMGRFGATSYTGNKIKGYKQLAKELLWHRTHNKWDYPFEIYANNGIDNLEFYHGS